MQVKHKIISCSSPAPQIDNHVNHILGSHRAPLYPSRSVLWGRSLAGDGPSVGNPQHHPFLEARPPRPLGPCSHRRTRDPSEWSATGRGHTWFRQCPQDSHHRYKWAHSGDGRMNLPCPHVENPVTQHFHMNHFTVEKVTP